MRHLLRNSIQAWRYATLFSCVLAVAGCSGGQQSNSSVPPPAQTLSISAPSAASATAGTAFSLAPQVSGAGSSALSYTISNKPAWASFSTTSGAISGTPAAADVGSYQNIVITVTNGSASASTGALTIAVQANAGVSAAVTWVAPDKNDDGSALTDLAGFRIHYGTISGNLAQQLDVADARATSRAVTGLTSGTWYFGVTAYTSRGVESAMSTQVTKTVP